MDDSFSVPVESIEYGGVLMPDRRTVEFLTLTEMFSHEAGSTPECPESLADFSVFRIVGIKTGFPLFRKDCHFYLSLIEMIPFLNCLL